MADRLGLLRWRVALRLGFRSVDEWLLATDPEDQAHQLAVCWVDRWGDEWKWLASVMHSQGVLQVACATGKQPAASDWREPASYEPQLDHMTDKVASPAQDWGAVEAAFRTLATGNFQWPSRPSSICS